ncbi:TPA: hypothetical protein ACG3O0_000272 [Clostridioides difficile]
MTTTKIPIKNIYFMLCYAWNVLTIDNNKILGKESFDNIYNLVSRILIVSVKQLQRKGFHNGYTSNEFSLYSLRGKINLSESIKQRSFLKKQLVCDYDELSSNIIFNQIIKASIKILLKYKDLDYNLRKELIKLSFLFVESMDITPTHYTFSNILYNRNNIYYKLAINTCQLLFEGLISNEKCNELMFSDFILNHKMAKLYEKFVLNFYKVHLDKEKFKVYSPKIYWDLNLSSSNNVAYLPDMKTDIVIENKHTNIQLIIDTKFYTDMFTQGNFSNKQTLKSNNLYQIYTYINNSSFNGKIKGLLLYPTVTNEFDSVFTYNNGTYILVKTLNLDTEWPLIKQQLFDISSICER